MTDWWEISRSTEETRLCSLTKAHPPPGAERQACEWMVLDPNFPQPSLGFELACIFEVVFALARRIDGHENVCLETVKRRTPLANNSYHRYTWLFVSITEFFSRFTWFISCHSSHWHVFSWDDGFDKASGDSTIPRISTRGNRIEAPLSNPFTPKNDQFQVPLQLHQKYYITQYEERGFS